MSNPKPKPFQDKGARTDRQKRLGAALRENLRKRKSQNQDRQIQEKTMGKVWFITGATRGIGAEIAKAALAAGEQVVATGRQPDSITQALGASGNLLTVGLDVTCEDQAISAVNAAVARFGRIDVVVNNAGFGLFGAVEELSDAEVPKQLDVNVFGLLNVTRAVLPVLRMQGSGHIINFSSILGAVGTPGGAAYCASKFAVEGISECLNLEVAPLGIHVTIIEPGPFRTDFLNKNSIVYAERVIDAYAKTVGPIRAATITRNGEQSGDPKKLAQAILTLAAEKSPPLRFTAGADAVKRLEEGLTRRNAELNAWKMLAVSLDYS